MDEQALHRACQTYLLSKHTTMWPHYSFTLINDGLDRAVETLAKEVRAVVQLLEDEEK